MIVKIVLFVMERFFTWGTHAQFINLLFAFFVSEVIFLYDKLLLMNFLIQLFILYFIYKILIDFILYNILPINFETFGHSWYFLLLSNVLGHTLGYLEGVVYEFEVLGWREAVLRWALCSFFATLISIPTFPSNFTFILILYRYWIYHLHFLRLTYKSLLIFIHS
jgi:hypothetical protein